MNHLPPGIPLSGSVSLYNAWNEPLPTWRDRWDLEQGRIPMLSWMGTSTKDTAAGKHDDLFGQRADAIRALGKPVFLRWFWEVDGVRATKRKAAGSPADYIAAWRHLHALFQAHGAANAVWVWCPVSLHFYTGTAQPFYPGDDVVDWICADGYNWAPGRAGDKWRGFASIYKDFYAWGLARGKPMMVGEFGVQERGPDEKAAWITDARQMVKARFPAIKAVVYFDVDKDYDWRMDTSPSALAAFREWVRDPYFNPRGLPLSP